MALLGDAVVTGGVVAVALGALEVAKLAILRLYHRHNHKGNHKHNPGASGTIRVDERFVALITANGTKIDQNLELTKGVLTTLQEQGKTLVEIKTMMRGWKGGGA